MRGRRAREEFPPEAPRAHLARASQELACELRALLRDRVEAVGLAARAALLQAGRERRDLVLPLLRRLPDQTIEDFLNLDLDSLEPWVSAAEGERVRWLLDRLTQAEAEVEVTSP